MYDFMTAMVKESVEKDRSLSRWIWQGFLKILNYLLRCILFCCMFNVESDDRQEEGVNHSGNETVRPVEPDLPHDGVITLLKPCAVVGGCTTHNTVNSDSLAVLLPPPPPPLPKFPFLQSGPMIEAREDDKKRALQTKQSNCGGRSVGDSVLQSELFQKRRIEADKHTLGSQKLTHTECNDLANSNRPIVVAPRLNVALSTITETVSPAQPAVSPPPPPPPPILKLPVISRVASKATPSNPPNNALAATPNTITAKDRGSIVTETSIQEALQKIKYKKRLQQDTGGAVNHTDVNGGSAVKAASAVLVTKIGKGVPPPVPAKKSKTVVNDVPMLGQHGRNVPQSVVDNTAVSVPSATQFTTKTEATIPMSPTSEGREVRSTKDSYSANKGAIHTVSTSHLSALLSEVEQGLKLKDYTLRKLKSSIAQPSRPRSESEVLNRAFNEIEDKLPDEKEVMHLSFHHHDYEWDIEQSPSLSCSSKIESSKNLSASSVAPLKEFLLPDIHENEPLCLNLAESDICVPDLNQGKALKVAVLARRKVMEDSMTSLDGDRSWDCDEDDSQTDMLLDGFEIVAKEDEALQTLGGR